MATGATLHAEMTRCGLRDSGHECSESEHELVFEKQTRLPEVIEAGVKVRLCHLQCLGEPSVNVYAP